MRASAKEKAVESFTGTAGPTLGTTPRSPEELDAARKNVEIYAAKLGLDGEGTKAVEAEILGMLGLLD